MFSAYMKMLESETADTYGAKRSKKHRGDKSSDKSSEKSSEKSKKKPKYLILTNSSVTV